MSAIRLRPLTNGQGIRKVKKGIHLVIGGIRHDQDESSFSSNDLWAPQD